MFSFILSRNCMANGAFSFILSRNCMANGAFFCLFCFILAKRCRNCLIVNLLESANPKEGQSKPCNKTLYSELFEQEPAGQNLIFQIRGNN